MRWMILALLIAAPVGASELRAEALAPRERQEFGVYLTAFGDPYPTAVGFNLAYALTSYLRAHIGYGRIPDVTPAETTITADTFGGGLKAYHPRWRLSPFVGVGWGHIKVDANGPLGELTIGGFSATDSHLYASAGAEWLAPSGLSLALGWNQSLKPGIGGLPHLSLGWFFDVF